MIVFWILAVTMIAVAVALILPPLVGRGHHATVSREAVNLAIFNERLAELEQEEADASERNQVRQELERELVLDASKETSGDRPRHRGSRLVAIAVVVSIPLLSILVYNQLGSHQALLGDPGSLQAATNQALPPDHPTVGGQAGTPSLEQMVVKLAARLE